MEHNIDLDAARKERPTSVTVTIRGQTFKAKPTVRPEDLIPWDDFYEGTDTSARHQIEVADDTICKFLFPDDQAKYRALRQEEDDPITVGELGAMIRALSAASSDVPTLASPLSGPTTTSDEAGSTDGQSSRAVLQSVSKP